VIADLDLAKRYVRDTATLLELIEQNPDVLRALLESGALQFLNNAFLELGAVWSRATVYWPISLSPSLEELAKQQDKTIESLFDRAPLLKWEG
jgi:hypothetical protein